jgi:predicted O-methyltransferase YrrM
MFSFITPFFRSTCRSILRGSYKSHYSNFFRRFYRPSIPILYFLSPKGQQYEFSENWSNHYLDNLRQLMVDGHLHNSKPLHYLEIGSHEGRSLVWVLENILNHPKSRATAVDIFYPSYLWSFIKNIKCSGSGHKVKIKAGFSKEILRTLKPNSYDIIYLDGSHSAAETYLDIGLSWDLLRPNGLLIIDDYLLGNGSLPQDLTPKISVDGFLAAFENISEILILNYQVIVKKTGNLAFGVIPFYMGSVVYDWYSKSLYLESGECFQLTQDEFVIIDQYIGRYKSSKDLNSAPITPEIQKIVEKYLAQSGAKNANT